MKMSKYNLGKSVFEINPRDKKVILVPGQVEDDASIRRGSPIIDTNQGLQNTVRKNPFVADAVVVDANIIDCIEVCPELHTMTSWKGCSLLRWAFLRRLGAHCGSHGASSSDAQSDPR